MLNTISQYIKINKCDTKIAVATVETVICRTMAYFMWLVQILDGSWSE